MYGGVHCFVDVSRASKLSALKMEGVRSSETSRRSDHFLAVKMPKNTVSFGSKYIVWAKYGITER